MFDNSRLTREDLRVRLRLAEHEMKAFQKLKRRASIRYTAFRFLALASLIVFTVALTERANNSLIMRVYITALSVLVIVCYMVTTKKQAASRMQYTDKEHTAGARANLLRQQLAGRDSSQGTDS